VQEDPLGRAELATVVGARRICPKLQYLSRRAHAVRDAAAHQRAAGHADEPGRGHEMGVETWPPIGHEHISWLKGRMGHLHLSEIAGAASFEDSEKAGLLLDHPVNLV
jgi:hypothetical protein